MKELSQYPLVLRPRHMAEIWGVTAKTIEKRVRLGTFPIPRLSHETTLAWSRIAVAKFFEAQTFESRKAS